MPSAWGRVWRNSKVERVPFIEHGTEADVNKAQTRNLGPLLPTTLLPTLPVSEPFPPLPF